MICYHKLACQLMSSVAVHYALDLPWGILNRNQPAITEVHDLLADSCATDGVDAS
jgi:hypothetical protein